MYSWCCFFFCLFASSYMKSFSNFSHFFCAQSPRCFKFYYEKAVCPCFCSSSLSLTKHVWGKFSCWKFYASSSLISKVLWEAEASLCTWIDSCMRIIVMHCIFNMWMPCITLDKPKERFSKSTFMKFHLIMVWFAYSLLE